MNPVDVILTVILVVVVILVIMVMRRNKKSGKGGCSCGCQNCSAPCGHHKNDTQESSEQSNTR